MTSFRRACMYSSPKKMCFRRFGTLKWEPRVCSTYFVPSSSGVPSSPCNLSSFLCTPLVPLVFTVR
eukprot:6484312-Prymnesium_polylepis.1